MASCCEVNPYVILSQVNQQGTSSATLTKQTTVPPGAGQTSNSAPVSRQNSPSLTDDDEEEEEDDDGATTSVSDDANDLACDLSQPGRPVSTPQTNSDVEDHPPSIQQAKAEPECSASVSEKGSSSWVNSRRRKSSRPQWHYEGTVLDKSHQPLAVNGTADDSLTAWDGDQGRDDDDEGQTAKDTATASDDNNDDICDDVNALSNCVTSH